MDEYRKELRRQSEMIRADKPDYKWWEDTSTKWHYNYHKHKMIELRKVLFIHLFERFEFQEIKKTHFSADIDRADFHRSMFNNYIDKIEKQSNQFWAV